MKLTILSIVMILVLFTSCMSRKPTVNYMQGIENDTLNYADLDLWAAHPEKEDMSDQFPKNFISDTTLNGIDVFFIYPTLLLKGSEWNADVHNRTLNKKIDQTTIKYQANVFNGLARIFAPRYRQMHIHGYRDSANGIKALDFAYQDVLQAFQYYVSHYNDGREMVIAAHSQGTNHAERLLKEVILQNDSIREHLKLAYLVGMPIVDNFADFPLCKNPLDLNCFLSWRTFSTGYYPPYIYGDSIAVTNPITWNSSKLKSDFGDHGGILMKNNKIRYKNCVRAESHQGLLWIDFQNIPMQKLFKQANYHIADYNLFWNNMRSNFIQRMSQ